MKFETIGTLEADFNSPDWYEDKFDDVRDALYAFKDQADAAILTLKDGSRHLRTKANMNGGYCECCSDREEVVKYEFLKVEL